MSVAEVGVALASHDGQTAILRIGGIGFGLEIVGDSEWALGATTARFVSGGPTDIALKAILGGAPELELGPRLFDSGGTWVLHKSSDGMAFVFSAAQADLSLRPYVILEVNGDLSRGVIHAMEPCQDAPSVYSPFEFPLSEVLTVHLLSRGRGVLLHAAGLSDRGRGNLFYGVSGAGKTTTSRLWCDQPGIEVLSDDRIIVRKHSDGFRAYGTPWHGEAEFAVPLSTPLERLFLLKQGVTNQIRSLSHREALARLMTCCFPTFWDPEGMAFTLSFLSEIASSLPCYELTFINDHSVVDFVRSL